MGGPSFSDLKRDAFLSARNLSFKDWCPTGGEFVESDKIEFFFSYDPHNRLNRDENEETPRVEFQIRKNILNGEILSCKLEYEIGDKIKTFNGDDVTALYLEIEKVAASKMPNRRK